MNRKETGYYGESIVREYLINKGYLLLDKNYVIRGGELDLIMSYDNEIIFIEVKTRRNDTFGTPLESITPQKQKRIFHASKVYLTKNNLWNKYSNIRYFAGIVRLDNKNNIESIEIIEDIFS